MRAPFGVKGGKDITIRHNTIVGDLPSLAYAMRLNSEGSNPPNEGIHFYNNVWSDPNGTMGAENQTRPNDFSDTPPAETTSFTLDNNLYWNGGANIPQDSGELVNYTDDSNRIIADPYLRDQSKITLPRWDSNFSQFADGSGRIREAFVKLVNLYGRPSIHSPVLDAASPTQSPSEDILGGPRSAGSRPDIGAYEIQYTGGDIWLHLPATFR
jgi:hypothetical protein